MPQATILLSMASCFHSCDYRPAHHTQHTLTLTSVLTLIYTLKISKLHIFFLLLFPYTLKNFKFFCFLSCALLCFPNVSLLSTGFFLLVFAHCFYHSCPCGILNCFLPKAMTLKMQQKYRFLPTLR